MSFTTDQLRAVLLHAALAFLFLTAAAMPISAQPAPRQPEPIAGTPPPVLRQVQAPAFATPEAAVHALIAALQAPTVEPLIAILGQRVLDSVPRDERQRSEMRRAAGAWLADQSSAITYPDEAQSRAVALFGAAQVPLPAVLTRLARGWAFDQQATIGAMRERRIGVNEANAIRGLRALAQAQERFRITDRTGDGVLQYARRIRSSPGQSDGLVASHFVPGPSIDHLNEAFARAEDDPEKPVLIPPGGYTYKILTGQGSHAEGGARSYLVNGRLTEGYAVVAWPVRPGETGLSTFIMDHRGVIFEHEFGARTADEARRITTFDPDPGWNRVQESEQ
ncbi:DUF2950 family protein [Pseudoroseomonas globiformis]|uniref:DUF2950 family protein n=1 Tax=Teichococcus globiformis TaxID=2307229 RepID=A0ABV7G6I8_9PROT